MLAGTQPNKHITASRLLLSIPAVTSIKGQLQPTMAMLMPALRLRLLRRPSRRRAPCTVITHTTPARCLLPAASHPLTRVVPFRLRLPHSLVLLVPNVDRSRRDLDLTAAPSVPRLAHLRMARKTTCGAQSASAAPTSARTANNTCKNQRRS
jgi:hypothetical protein